VFGLFVELIILHNFIVRQFFVNNGTACPLFEIRNYFSIL